MKAVEVPLTRLRAICAQDTPSDETLLLLMEVNERGKAL